MPSEPRTRRVVVIVPELLGDPSVLRQRLAALSRITELGTLFKLSPMPAVETREALFLGMNPQEGQLRQGPLTVAALGADPPVRSTHFHLSLLSFSDGVAAVPNVEIDSRDQKILMELAKKLNTRMLTIVEGDGLDHGLVWESVGDLLTRPPSDVDGHVIKSYLPEGDAEVQLRRLIDDSINILSEIELNERRIDEGLPPFNLLWPWGEGVREPVPNLALRRGEPSAVLSGSMRLQGLSRLAGYSHTDRRAFGRGTNVRLQMIREKCLGATTTLVVIDAIEGFRREAKLEESEWFAHELDVALLEPLVSRALTESTRLTVLAPGDGVGLGVAYQTLDAASNSLPFDERSLDERTLPNRALWDAVAEGLAP